MHHVSTWLVLLAVLGTLSTTAHAASNWTWGPAEFSAFYTAEERETALVTHGLPCLRSSGPHRVVERSDVRDEP
jgi:hypothetical protein